MPKTFRDHTPRPCSQSEPGAPGLSGKLKNARAAGLWLTETFAGSKTERLAPPQTGSTDGEPGDKRVALPARLRGIPEPSGSRRRPCRVGPGHRRWHGGAHGPSANDDTE